MGAVPTSGGSCAITVTPPVDHFQVTAPAASGLTCEAVTYTIKACSNAACSSVLTTGASGTLVLSGTVKTYRYLDEEEESQDSNTAGGSK